MWGEVQRAAGAMERTVELLHSRPSIVTPATPVALAGPRGQIAIRAPELQLSVATRHTRARRFQPRHRARGNRGVRRPFRRGQEHGVPAAAAFLRPERGPHTHRRRRHRDRAIRPAVRARIGLVPQETMIFGASARENIRYGRPGATDADIEAAARAAAADEFIRRLPEGYDTFLGETRRPAVGRPEAAHRHRARDPQESADPAARRGDELARFRERAARAGRAREAHAQPHHAGDRAPAGDRHQFRPHRRHRPRSHRRHGPPRGIAARQRVVCATRGATIRRIESEPEKTHGLCRWIPDPRAAAGIADEYKKMSTQAGKVWMDHGALGYHECVADDVQVRQARLLSLRA